MEKIIEKIRHYYNVMGDLNHMNLILKISLTVVGISFVFLIFTLGRVATRPPLVITVLPDGTAIETAYAMDSKDIITETEVHRFINEFLSYKYDWSPASATQQMNKAVSFLTEDLKKQVLSKLSEDIVYIQNTQMAQKLYVKKITPVDTQPFSEKKEYIAEGDRVIGIKDAKFASVFRAHIGVLKLKRNHDDLHGLKVFSFKEIQVEKEN
ncbi:MAG: hypothetical protein HYS98_01045 [Deltaproteobacteria bacterium]|nr:hypothetical protein [Deltaproteobacteria bacterium]